MMPSVHPPRPDEPPSVTGRYHLLGPELDVVEEWALYQRPGDVLVWRGEQRGVQFGQSFRRLGHAVAYNGRLERLQLHQHTPAGLHRQTYTFYDDGVLVNDNRVPGRQMLPARAGTPVVGPMVSLPLWPLPAATPSTLWIYATAAGLLASTVAHTLWRDAGTAHLTSGDEKWTCVRWHLTDPWGREHAIWMTTLTVIRWERPEGTAQLVRWQEV